MLIQSLKYFAAPSLLALWIIFYFLMNIEIGGGPHQGLYESLAKIIHLGFLGIIGLSHSIWTTLLLALLLRFSIIDLWKKEPNEALFFTITGVVIPLAIILIFSPPVMVPRYFLSTLIIFLLLSGKILSQVVCSPSNQLTTIFSYTIISLLLFLSIYSQYDLKQYGNGTYSQALQWIVKHSTQSTKIRVGGDHNFRNSVTFNFYRERLGLEEQMEYVIKPDCKNCDFDWFLAHDLQNSPCPAPERNNGIKWQIL